MKAESFFSLSLPYKSPKTELIFDLKNPFATIIKNKDSRKKDFGPNANKNRVCIENACRLTRTGCGYLPSGVTKHGWISYNSRENEMLYIIRW